MPWVHSGENNQIDDFPLGGVETGTASRMSAVSGMPLTPSERI